MSPFQVGRFHIGPACHHFRSIAAEGTHITHKTLAFHIGRVLVFWPCDSLFPIWGRKFYFYTKLFKKEEKGMQTPYHALPEDFSARISSPGIQDHSSSTPGEASGTG